MKWHPFAESSIDCRISDDERAQRKNDGNKKKHTQATTPQTEASSFSEPQLDVEKHA